MAAHNGQLASASLRLWASARLRLAARFACRPRGFTLIELSFVVSIIGILAGIAIPNFLVYQRRAQATEAIVALETIAYLEQTHILDTGETLACEPRPPAVPSELVLFEPTESWRRLGFELVGRVRFQYEVEKRGPRGFVAVARGDLDRDGEPGVYRLDGERLSVEMPRAGTE